MARQRVKKIDNLIWDGSTGSSNGLAAGSSAAVNFAVTGNAPSTLLRLRGTHICFLDGVQAPGVLNVVRYGIVKVPEGSGTTVQYDPASDETAPWLFYNSVLLGYEEMVTDAIGLTEISSFREIVDNKAMRRMRPDEELQWAVNNTALVGSAAINAGFAIRFLQGF